MKSTFNFFYKLLLFVIINSGYLLSQTLTISSPSLNDTANYGVTKQITWNWTGVSGTVKIELSTNGGTTWSSINANVVNQNGLNSYSWQPGNTPSNNCRIKITSNEYPAISATSNVFVIRSLILLSPSTGNHIQANKTFNILWSSSYLSSLRLEYSTNNGSSWNLIQTGVNPTASPYPWTVPNNIGNQVIVRISDANKSTLDPNCYKQQSGSFSICNLSMVSPNGGEFLLSSNNYNIQWSSTSNISFINLEYSTDNGANWGYIAQNLNASTGSYIWNVTNNTSNNQALIRVTDAQYPNYVYDVSDNPFTIGQLRVNSPNGGGGEGYLAGSTVTISWTSTNISYINIFYTLDNITYVPIALNYDASSGSYDWSIPNGINTDKAKIKIVDVSDPSRYDESNSNFIISTVTLNSVNNNVQTGKTVTLNWVAGSFVGNINITYSVDGGSTYPYTIASNISSSLGTYNWVVPFGITGDNCKVKISSVQYPNIYAISNTFRIAEIQLIYPAGTDGWIAGNNYTITWTKSSNVNNVNIYISTNNGINWSLPITTTSSTSYNYTVNPSFDYNQFKVKVEDATSTEINSENSTGFKVGKITLISPVGGEIWNVGTTKTISWNTTSFINNVRLEYSTNAGTSWNLINIVSAASGSYNWVVPNVSTNNAIIRISDAEVTGIYAQSSTFTIGSITVTYPNGGEAFNVNSNVNITWSALGITNVNLYYSLNGGANWTKIASNITAAGGSYTWNVPDNISSQYLIRISDASDTTYYDNSNGVFRVGKITVIQPTTQKLKQGGTYLIKWSASSNISNVFIYYSTNNGLNWNLIQGNVNAALGQYNWNVPNVTSSQCKIRIEDALSANIYGENSGNFSISYITVSNPNGGESWFSTSTQNITWTSSADVANVKIYVSTNGTTFSSTPIYSGANTGSYSWIVDGSYISQSARIKVEDAINPQITDSSDNVFTITPLRLTAPNTSITLYQGQNYNITWDYDPAKVSSVKIEYSTNGGTSWNQIVASTPSTGVYNWTVPAIVTNTCVIKITANDNPSFYDISDNTFSINTISLNSPNGGENWLSGSVHNITWTNIPGVTSLNLYYSLDGGASWRLFKTGVNAAAQSYSWTIPDSASNMVKIKIAASDNSAIYDISDNNFTISSLKLLSPVGGENWMAGNQYYIQWEAQYLQSIKIEYSTNGGTTWISPEIATAVPASNGTYLWTVPNNPSNQAKIRITSDNPVDNSITKSSPANFTISSLQITNPTSSTAFQEGKTSTIQWNASNIDFVNIDVTTDNGVNWIPIAVGHPASLGSYNWNVPSNYSSSNCKIRIYDQANFVRLATSSTFNISKLNITKPISTDKWFLGTTKRIQWQSNNVSIVNIYYSTDNGVTWPITIASNYPANVGYYDWVVSGLVTANGKIRIESVDKPSITSTSDAFQTSTIQITSPAGNESWQVGSIKNITWNYGNITNILIFYSTNGTTWSQIGTGPINAALQTYAWTIPDISSNSVRIKIADASDTSRNAISNTFKIGKITVLYPNGSENLQSGKSYNITWSSYSSVANVKIEYSTNSGVSWNVITPSVQASLGTFPWVVTNITGSSFRIRVSDADAVSPTEFINDISDNNFSVKRLDLISPVGGEFFQIGKSKQISWNIGNISTLRIDLSTDGSNFFNIAEIPGSNSTHNLLLTNPSYVSSSCYIKIYDKDNPSIVSVSPSSFTIKRLDLISPNGGEIKQAGVADTIRWQASGVSNISLSYSTDGGLNFSNNIVLNQPANLGYYIWTIPANLYGNNFRVKITDFDVNSINDTSDGNYTIRQLAITLPNSTSKYNVGLPLTVNWTASNLSQINIDLSTDGGVSYSYNLASNLNATLGTYTWVIPVSLTPSSNCKIRITDSNNPTVQIVSSTFSIAKLKLLVPNDGTQNWQTGTQQTIFWTSSANVSNVKLEYTINNGVTWTTIINSVAASSGNYSWNIPSTAASNNVKIRISDVSNANVIDSSDNVFNIRRLDIISPNGGQSYAASSLQTITWNASNVSNVKIEYQSSSSGPWNLIAIVPANSTPYNWTIPPTTSNEYKIRISDAAYSNITSQSVNTFKVGSISVTRPNTAEEFQVGKVLPIRWTASSNINLVNIHFSTDNGTTWYNVAQNISASAGSYDWTIINKPSSNCLIRVTDVTTDTIVTGCIRDVSDATFKVKYINLNSPNGNETWKIGSNQNITWSASSNINNVNIYLSTNNGNTWSILLANNIIASTGNYIWSNIGNYPFSSCKIKVIDASNNNIADSSDNSFKIGNISIVEPIAMSSYKTNSPMIIKWTSSSNVTAVNIYYSPDGISWTQQIGSNIPSNSGTNEFSWVTPLTATNNAKIKIVDAQSGSTIEDVSNTFRITQLNIVSPVSTDKWQVGTTKVISWNGQSVSNVNISVLDNSNNSYSIVNNTSNTNYSWLIPDVPFFNASSFKIVVTDVSNPMNSDTSAAFTICKLKVDSPNGGENIYAGTNYTISWTSYNINNVKIEYSSNNGTSWNTIVGNISSSNGSNNYNWLVPTDTSANYRVRVTDFSNSAITDQSDNKFTISKIFVTSPNGGEKWQIGTTKTITWKSSGINQVNIYCNYGAGNITIATNVSSVSGTGSYNWVIPDNPLLYSTNLKIIIASSTDPTKADTSDNTFTINKLQVVVPNGAENWFNGSTKTISWESRNINNVKLEYSTNNGITWENIATVSSNNGINNYNWLVPSDTSSNCLVRISDASNPSIVDLSDNKFNILGIFITSPTTGDKWRNALQKTISWKSNYATNVNIYILTPTGKSKIGSNILSPVGGSSYNWVVLDSNKYYTNNNLILIEDINDNTRSDTSNNYFSISKLDITSPNSNVNWFASSNQTISWISQNISNVIIEFSSNNGTNWSTVATLASTNGNNSYSWTVPNIASSQCLIRIKDATTGNILSDTSNTNFTISTLSLNSPLANYKWQIGKINQIKWTSSNIAQVKLEYYDVATANWITIATVNASLGTYNWQIPNSGLQVSNLYKIRISAADDPSKNVVSDNFTISNLSLTNYNGGEFVQAAKSIIINWNKNTFVDYVNIKYTTDNGNTWNSIADNISVTSYTWNLPDVALNNVKLLIEDASANSFIKDTSDAPFTIARLKILSPNGGEYIREGTKTNITWVAQNTNSLRLEYSSNHGQSWNIIANSVNAATGSYTWTLPYGLVTNQLSIRAYDVVNTNILDSSDAKIRVPRLTITNPIGGETWLAKDVKNITWNSQYLPTSTLSLEYTTDNGVNWTPIINNLSTSLTSYNWTLPPTALNNVKIRIKDNTYNTLSDTIDGSFTITAPTINITTPNGGEVLLKDQPYTIQYTKSPDVSTVNIYSRLEGKSGWRLLASNTAAITFAWTPDSAGNYKIKVVDFANQNIVGDSSDSYVIVKHMKVTVPSGGELWQVGKNYAIKWQASSNVSTVKIEYSTNAGTTWNLITTGVNASNLQYSWSIPYSLDGKQVYIKVTDELSSSVINDVSDGFVTISNLQLTYPNSSTDGLVSGKQYQITWTNSTSISNVNIYYTADGGPLQSIQNNVSASSGQYNWLVPPINSNNVKIVIQDASNPLIVDSSDNAFKVASLTVISPNGGENLRIGRNANISWSNSNNVTKVNIYYSLNNGITWFIYGVNVDASNPLNNFNWKIPNIISTTSALMKIVDVDNPNIYDVSDANFTLSNLYVTYPNGGEKLSAGKKHTITWVSHNVVTNHRLQYTLDGINWNDIITLPSTTTTYEWTLPSDTSTNTAKIRIMDPTLTEGDTSDANFKIGYIKILSPVNTAVLQSNRNVMIYWRNSTNIGAVNIKYKIGTSLPSIIADNYTSPTKTFNWNIPINLFGNNIKLIISDVSSENTLADTIDINLIKLQLTSLTGGQKILANKVYPITWAVSNYSGNVRIELSTNNGLNWSAIAGASNLPATSGLFNWLVNNNLGFQNRIRIICNDYSTVRDSSSNIFTISELKVTSPTSTSNFKAGTTQTISWTSSIDINKVNIYFSSDNGTSWQTIKTNYDYIGLSGSYNWIAPSITSANCRIRIEDSQNPTNSDTSQAFNVYTPTITVVNPNTNIKLLAGKSYTIAWNKQYVTNVKIEYSTNGGSNWKLIASPQAGTSYVWNIPFDTTNNAKIKITDLSDTTIYDISDLPFTISSIKFNSPLGGEVTQVNKTFIIKWKTSFIDKIKIDYTTNGTNWFEIVNNYDANVGSYSWVVPTYSTSLKFRIYDADNLSNYVESNAITSANIVVTNPLGGEIFQSGNNIKIKWTSQNINNVKLEYSLDNGITWLTIANSIPAALGGVGYDWSVDTSIASRKCLIRISDENYSSVHSIPNSVFKIGNILLLSPNGGEIRQNYSVDTIKWYNKNSTSNVKLYYSTNNGTNWNLITTLTTNPYGGQYIWNPNISNPTTNMLIKVEDAEGVIKDSSNATYTLVNLVLQTPNGGEYLQAGTTKKIIWNASNLGNISIRYTTNDGITWKEVVSNIASSTGNYDWIIPSNISSKNCRIKLFAVSDSNRIYTISANKFTIGKITLLSFTGGEKIKVGTSQIIRWSRSSSVDFINIYYYNGTNWQTIATNVDASLSKYIWNVPDNPSATARIKITDAMSNFNIVDSSASTFRVSRIYVTSPNGGEVYRAGIVYPIKWNVSSDITSLKLEYTTDDGLNWVTINNNVNPASGTYNWKMPDTASTGYRIRISDALVSAEISDTSDNIFTVKKLQLNSPNSATNWLANTNQTITWASTGINQVMLQYTTNNGANWVNITSTPLSAFTGNYTWVTPNLSSPSVKVRIYDYTMPSVADTSEQFLIYKPQITLTAPNGGESWKVGSNQTITWNYAYVTRLKIEYSTDGGNTYNLIDDNVNPASGSYNWTIPNTSTKKAIVKLTDYNNSTVKDTSDNTFRIKNIILLSPNGSENFQVLRTYPIKWNSGGIDNIKIDYSTNNGTNWFNIGTISADSNKFNWNITLSYPTSNNYTIRVSDVDDNTIFDVSDNKFNVKYLKLNAPQGGFAVMYDSLVSIQWAASANIQNVKLQYRISDVDPWNNISGSPANVGIYNSWKAPLTASSFYKVRVVDSVSNYVYDSTDTYLKVANITLNTNLSGVSVQVGKALSLSWNNTNNISNVKIELSTNNGSSWSTLVTNYPTGATSGSYNFVVPNTPTTQAVIRISDQNNANIYTKSAVFTINYLAITKPIINESWKVSTSQQITWVSNNISNVNIYLSTNSGTSWLLIANNVVSNNGNNTYNWIVGNYASNNCLIKITDAVDENKASTISPSNFKIGDISIIKPLAGEKWQAGLVKRIEWNKSTNISNINIEYSINGTTWLPIATNINATPGYYDWKVVENPTTNAQIRITDANGIGIYGISPSFTIVKIKVDYPNGNETISANSNVVIKWQSANVTNVNIDYTTNGGTSWTNIVNNFPANLLQTNWTVPNLAISANNCLIRVYDSSDPTIVDTSNGKFTIVVPKLTVLEPNSSTIWQAGTQKIIKWTNDYVSDVKIEYTTNNGTSWNTIVASTPASSLQYNWNIPNIPSNNYKIKITDINNSSVWDTSRTFTVSLLNIVTPSGGENLKVNTTFPITFNAYYTGNIKIQYSTNNGLSWDNEIINSLAISNGLNTYNWIVPNIPSNQLKIRILTLSDTSIKSTSNSFRIANIMVTAPNDSLIWQTGTYKNITWANSTNISTVNIDYSTDNGASWNVIATALPASSGSYLWQIPDNPSNQALIRVSDASTPSMYDISDKKFTLAQLRITAPNGGEKIKAQSNFTIKWQSAYVNNLKIEYSTNNGSSWYLITNSANSSNKQYTWNVPDIVSNSYKIKISDSLNNFIYDISDSVFAVYKPTVTLTTFNSGVYQAGKTYSIKWTTSDIANVNIQYSLNNGTTWYNIATNIPSSLGIYNWTIPDSSSQNARIKIVDYTDNNYYDISDNTFTIAQMKLLSPVGGEQYQIDNYRTIQWFSKNIGNVRIELSTDNGINWQSITTVSTINGINSYSWRVENKPSNLCKIRIRDINYPEIKDSSANSFRISNVQLLSPNGNERLQEGRIYKIQYSTSTNVNNIILEYTTNNGNNWNIITSSAPASLGEYNWLVPVNTASANCKVRIKDLDANSILDTSDNKFSIVALRLITPNGGEVWQANSIKRIRWQAANAGNIKLEYSTNFGNTWTTIIDNYPVDSLYYDWSIPLAALSDNAQLRISEYNNATIFDTCDNRFKIFIPQIKVNYPNGNENLLVGKNYNIQWDASYINNVKLEYSFDNGLNWYTIATVPASNKTYSWTVPNNTTRKALIRISDANDPTFNDVSDQRFNIVNIIIYSPNGGENWQAKSTKQLRWKTYEIDNISIDYTTDNGLSWKPIGIVNALLDSTKSWVIPNSPTALAKIRIRMSNDTTVSVISSSTFTISSIELVNFTGNENVKIGKIYPIKWQSYFLNNLKIEFSTNNGSTWTQIVNSTPASNGQYNWLIPNIAGNNYLIKISSSADSEIKDSSKSTFRVANVSLNFPNGNEVFQANTIKNILWTKTSNVARVKIDFSSNNGKTWSNIISNTTLDSSLSWTVPNILSDSCRIKITDMVSNEITDSSGMFTIANIKFIKPVAGSVIQANKPVVIKWSSKNIQNLTIEYTTNNGLVWNTIKSNTPYYPDSLIWNVPDLVTTNLKLKIYDPLHPEIQDTTQFSIKIAKLQLTSLTGGENIQAGKQFNITWIDSLVTTVKLEYSTNNGLSWRIISTAIPAINKNYIWNIPNTPSINCKIRISDVYNPEIADLSTQVFTISLLRIDNPNGGESVQALKYKKIYYTKSNNISNLKLEYSTDNGINWNIITNSTADSIYNWLVPNIPSNTCRLRISDANNPNISDVSDTTFKIYYLKLLTPNGEIKQIGTQANISWEYSSNISRVSLYYSTNAGNNWIEIKRNIAADTNGSNYLWQIPNTPTKQALVRVAMAYNNEIFDDSDSLLTLSTIKILFPNGNNHLQVHRYYDIKWSYGYVNNVNIDYSVNGGTTWMNIVSNYPADSMKYKWYVNDTVAQNAILRIQYSADNSIYDISDNPFRISKLELLSPNGGEKWLNNSSKIITWECSNDVKLVRIFYSYDNGLTWIKIADSVNGQAKSYLWNIPKLSDIQTTDKMRIKIVDSTFNFAQTVYDISDNKFTICNINIFNPRANDYIQVGKKATITFNTKNINRLRIEYRTSPFEPWNTIDTGVVTNTGKYDWIIPEDSTLVSNYFQFKLTDMHDDSIYVLSESYQICKYINLSSPNGGTQEVLRIGSAYPIKWFGSSNISRVRIELHGVQLNPILLATVNNYSGITNVYNWTIQNTPSKIARIVIRDADVLSIADSSNLTFSLAPFPKLDKIAKIQKDTVIFKFVGNNFEDMILDSLFYTTLPNASEWIYTNNYSAPTKFISSGKDILIKWYAYKDLGNFEKIDNNVKFIFKSATTRYEIIIDSVGFDNVAPQLPKLKFNYKYWDKQIVSWDSVKNDISTPIKFKVDVSKNFTFDTLYYTGRFITNNSLTIDKLFNNTKYYVRIQVMDNLNNVSNYFVDSIFTPLVCDYDSNNVVDVIDLAKFKKAWNENNLSEADFAPFEGIFPVVKVVGNRRLDAEDLYLFIKMWNYTQNNYTLFKKVKNNFVNTQNISERIERIISDKNNKLIIPINFEQNNAAIGVSLKFNPKYIKIDSAYIGNSKKQFLNLVYIDSVKGVLRVDAVALSGNITPNDVKLNLVVKNFFDSKHFEDSLTFTAMAVDDSITRKTMKNYTLALNKIPDDFKLEQNYPNPFNPTTIIKYQLPYKAKIELKIYNILGQEIATLINQEQNAGYHTIQFNANEIRGGLASGVYFYRIVAGKFVQTKKMLLIK